MLYWYSSACQVSSRPQKNQTCFGSGPILNGFYARLEDEYELKERAGLLTRKLTVISNTGRALTNIIDTERSVRLEQIIIVLILLGVISSVSQIFFHFN